jgi:hypothetical protein
MTAAQGCAFVLQRCDLCTSCFELDRAPRQAGYGFLVSRLKVRVQGLQARDRPPCRFEMRTRSRKLELQCREFELSRLFVRVGRRPDLASEIISEMQTWPPRS